MQRPILLVTAAPWCLEKALEEVGDTLYPLDATVHVVEECGVLLVYASTLTPWRAIGELMKYPPAYASRIVPIEELVPSSPDHVVGAVKRIIEARRLRLERYAVQVYRHGVNVDTDEWRHRIGELLARELGSPPWRGKPRYVVDVELLCKGSAVVSVLPWKLDRVSVWRKLKWPWAWSLGVEG